MLHARTLEAQDNPSSTTSERLAAPLVRFVGVQKSYDGLHLVVRQLDLDIRRGEFLTLLGPSGSGKTTTLMMLAGFESPTAGEILLDGKPITRTPPHRRNFGMVFQNYALFPHLTVGQNVAYPLTVRKATKAEQATRVAKALDMVRLNGMSDRLPPQLSGGQQQRVALARALVFEPQLLLMDEPLGALDKQLREHMQIELKELHRQLGVTFVFVTHDQGEALTMSDRVAVFNDGAIQQVDAADRIYEAPANRFVAGFIGDNTTLRGTVRAVQSDPGTVRCDIVLADGRVLIGMNVNGAAVGASVEACIRPERIAIQPDTRAEAVKWSRQHAAGAGARRDLFRRSSAPAVRGRRRPAGRHREAAAFGAACAGNGRSHLARVPHRVHAHLCVSETFFHPVTGGVDTMKKSILATALVGAVTAAVSLGAAAQQITVVNFGGANANAQKKAYYEPFEKGGTKVVSVEYNGEQAKIKAMVETKKVTWDVVEVESPDVARGCDEGLFEKLDYSKIGNRADFIPAAVTECGIGVFVWSTVMAYNGDKLKDGPKTWADFFDTKKFPGKRGMRKGARYNLEFALMADGVTAGRRLQGAGHAGRSGSCVQEARRAEVEHPVVGSGRAAAAIPGRWRRGDEHGLQRPHRRREPRRQEPEDQLDRRHLRPRLLGHPEGRTEQGCLAEVHRLRQHARCPGRVRQEHRLRPDQQQGARQTRRQGSGELAHVAGELRRRAPVRPEVLGRPGREPREALCFVGDELTGS